MELKTCNTKTLKINRVLKHRSLAAGQNEPICKLIQLPLPGILGHQETQKRRCTFAIFLCVLSFLCLFPANLATVLHKLVDVKGNEAFREVRIMYDLYHPNDGGDTTPSSSLSSTNTDTSVNTYRAGKGTDSYPSAKWYPTNILYPWSQPQIVSHGLSETVMSSSTQHHPQYYIEQNMLRPFSQTTKFTIKNAASHKLVRGRPLFAEVDFVPKYIPQQTYYVAVSVTLPAHIRGRPWILGWHQEVFPIPTCRLCTNRDQSFTLPVTLFLPDDGWCPEGRVPTIWKIEVITRESNRVMDQTDMILAYGYDELRQLFIVNDANSTVHCRGISEAIVA